MRQLLLIFDSPGFLDLAHNVPTSWFITLLPLPPNKIGFGLFAGMRRYTRGSIDERDKDETRNFAKRHARNGFLVFFYVGFIDRRSRVLSQGVSGTP
jgi:hypothetical protein